MIEFLLGARLLAHVEAKDLGWVLGGEVGIYTRRRPDRVRGADVAFLSRRRSPKRPGRKFLEVAPELIVEILSPDDRWPDINQKIDEYFAIGVDRVWIVEPDDRAVRVYRSSTEHARLGETDTLRGEGLLEGFTLPVATLFED